MWVIVERCLSFSLCLSCGYSYLFALRSLRSTHVPHRSWKVETVYRKKQFHNLNLLLYSVTLTNGMLLNALKIKGVEIGWQPWQGFLKQSLLNLILQRLSPLKHSLDPKVILEVHTLF